MKGPFRLAAAAAIVLAGFGASVSAQLPPALDEALRDIFERNVFATEPFGPTAWLDGGDRYTSLRGTDLRDLVEVLTATGRSEVVVAGRDLVPAGRSAPIQIRGYAWSTDRSRLLIFTNTRRVWRQHTRGDYWIYDRGTRALRQLGGGAQEASLMFAKFSPDGRQVAYVRENDIYVEDVVTGRITPLTTDGGSETINGTSDWVNEEELDLRDAFRWSPDGRHIAYWQFDTRGVGRFVLVNYTDALYPALTTFAYPKPGTTNSAVRVGVVPVSGGPTVWVAAEGDPRQHYLARLEWLDPGTLAIQQLNRLQNRNSLLLADAATGAARRIFLDQSDAWVDVSDPMRLLPDGESLLFVSERDGWRHAYAVSRAGGAPRLLTKFDGDIQSVEGIDAAAGRLYFIASPQRSIERHLYSSSLTGDGTVARVTPDGQPGTHTYDIAPNGQWAIHTYSRADVPPRIEIVRLPSHERVRTEVTNERLAKALTDVAAQPIEFFTVETGEEAKLDGYLIKPRTFDPARKYPVIVHVYGEPASTTVNDRWGGTGILFHRALADAGYLVVSFDNRGTPALKGATWRKVVYGAVGELSARDQAAALRAFGAARPYADMGRVAIYGSSGGGSNTLNAMFRYPDVYKVGVAIAPVPDQRLYDTIYQERYMGLPDDNAKGYAAGSPIHFAEGLEGRLLIVHGTGDDNVHHQGTERLANRLIELGKPFDMMLYPNRTHALSEGPGTSIHLRRLVARYILEHLPPSP
jgi:dipeptidyl-peptidase-4